MCIHIVLTAPLMYYAYYGPPAVAYSYHLHYITESWDQKVTIMTHMQQHT